MPKLGVVTTAAPGREENLNLMLMQLAQCRPAIVAVQVVLDGAGLRSIPVSNTDYEVEYTVVPKHQPGQEQPRNVGARALREQFPDLTHVWFLDSDILVEREAVDAYEIALNYYPDCILVGPYDWLPVGYREPHPELHTDQRWAMFEEREPGPWVADLGVALGNFGGNLIWPIDRFMEVGGFHPMLHHGRCEDGELGLRAASHEIPMLLVKEARGYHLAHAVDEQGALEKNRRDVPLLNSWHPWVQVKCNQCGQEWKDKGDGVCIYCGSQENSGGLIVTEADGARFDFMCPKCGKQVNTLEMWDHESTHKTAERIADSGLTVLPERAVAELSGAGDLIMPDDLSTMPSVATLVEDRRQHALEDAFRHLVEVEYWAIDELADALATHPVRIQELLERSQARSHE